MRFVRQDGVKYCREVIIGGRQVDDDDLFWTPLAPEGSLPSSATILCS
jgi:hypothetical protein